MGIYLGNLSENQMAERLGMTFTDEELDFLHKTRSQKASLSKKDSWHCFDIPFFCSCGSKDFLEKVKTIIFNHISEHNGCLFELGLDEVD